MLTVPFHPWDWIDFFFDITLVGSLLCVNQIPISHVKEGKICRFGMQWKKKRLRVRLICMMADHSPLLCVGSSWWMGTKERCNVCLMPLENQKGLICATQCFLPVDRSHGRKLGRLNSTGGLNSDFTCCTVHCRKWQTDTFVHCCCKINQRVPHWSRVVWCWVWHRVYPLLDLAACPQNVISKRSLHL